MTELRMMAFGILCVASLLLAGTAHASRDENGRDVEKEVVTLPAGEVINRDYFAVGEVVEISGIVNGDAYVAGGRVLVDGRINGDLIAAGGKVMISGDISQDARIAGGSIKINGKIGRNLTVGGGNIDLADSASVYGGMAGFGGSISLAGPVGNNVKIAAGNLTVSDEIKGDLEAAVGELRLTSRAAVKGDLAYWSDREASIDERAEIGGEIRHEKTFKELKPSKEKIFGVITGFALLLKIISFVSTLAVGLLLIRLFPNFNTAAVSQLRGRPWASLGIGLVFLVVVPVIVLLLLATLAGIHLALVVLALYLVSLYLSRIFVILWVGTALFRSLGKEMPSGWSFLTGLIIYFALTFIPVLGVVLAVLVLLFGLGAAVLTERDIYLAAREKAII
jgi:hypothetical protein